MCCFSKILNNLLAFPVCSEEVNKCYYVLYDANCEPFNKSLVSIHSREEQDFIAANFEAILSVLQTSGILIGECKIGSKCHYVNASVLMKLSQKTRL